MAWCIDGTFYHSGDGAPPTYINNDGLVREYVESNNTSDGKLTILERTIERLERRIVELEGNSRKRPSFIDFHFLKEKKVEPLYIDRDISDEDLDTFLDLM